MKHKIPILEFRLKNGLKLLVSERHSHPVVCCMIWYRVGSRNEGRGETGVSHFLEHMMFKGTKRFRKGEIDRLSAQLGGSNNAFTNTDYTGYYFNFASDRWQIALDIEASRMRGCLLDEKEFLAEKKVVFEELKMGKDDPWRDLYQEVQSTAFMVHPYHHPVIGWESDLESLSRERMKSYYEKYYAPNHAVLVIAGDVKAGEVFREVQKRFGKIPAQQLSEQTAIAPEPEQRGEKRIILKRPTQLHRLAIAYRTCRIGEPDDYALDLISILLSHGKSGRLYRKLVRSGLALHASAENDSRIDPGLFWVGAELAEGKSSQKLEQSILEELEIRLTQELLTSEELKKLKRIVSSGFFFQQETASDIAEKLGRFEIQAKVSLLNRYVEKIKKVNAARIREVARRYFREDNRTIGHAKPERKK